MRRNQALAKQRSGGLTVGPVINIGSADLAEQVAYLGFDWVWLDWQHGQFTEHTLNDALARFMAVESTPIVRVKSHEPGTINRVLDMGAMGVIVPYVQNAAQARAITQAVYYPPLGIRSGGGMRLALLGGEGGSAEYYAKANDEIMLVLMVETEEAVSNIDEIMRVPGVHVVLIGPGDLMIDVKAHGHDAARHEQLVLEVAAASKRTGTAAGYVSPTRESAEQRIAQGFHFINYLSDTAVLLGGLREARALSRSWSQ